MGKEKKDQLPDEFLERAMQNEDEVPYAIDDPEAAKDESDEASTDDKEHRDKEGKAAKKKSHSEREERARKSFRQFITDDDGESPINLRSILGGDMFGGRRFRRQMWYFLMLCAMAVVYVANRYACQRAEIHREELTGELQDRKFKALTAAAELTEFSMRSNVEENLPDSTLQTATRAAYSLPVTVIEEPADSTAN